jgi:hypothetical protein
VTLPGRSPERGAGDSDAERVLAQALRAMAGGSKQSRSDDPVGGLRLNRLQILLIAVIAGLLIGITVGLVSLIG